MTVELRCGDVDTFFLICDHALSNDEEFRNYITKMSWQKSDRVTAVGNQANSCLTTAELEQLFLKYSSLLLYQNWQDLNQRMRASMPCPSPNNVMRNALWRAVSQ